MAASESGEAVSFKYVGQCAEGNCAFELECQNEAVAQRTAGRHEGNNDLTHEVSIEVVIDD